MFHIEENPQCCEIGCKEGAPSVLAERFVRDHVRWLDQVVPQGERRCGGFTPTANLVVHVCDVALNG